METTNIRYHLNPFGSFEDETYQSMGLLTYVTFYRIIVWQMALLHIFYSGGLMSWSSVSFKIYHFENIARPYNPCIKYRNQETNEQPW
jgi:hypothetical protein